jgi:hypothetical protein
MSDAELSDKFRQCAAWGGLDQDRANKLLELAWRIEESEDVGEVARGLRRDVP